MKTPVSPPGIPKSYLTTTVDSPGSDKKVPTEKAVQSAIGAVGGGDVTGPAGAVAGNLPALDATGKILSDSGSKPTDFAPATSGSSLLKGDGSGGTAAAGAGDIPDLSTYYIPVTYTSNIATAVSAYDAVYMNASGEADPAKGDSATTMPCIGICITSVDDLITYQVAGRVTNEGWSFTSLGQPVYVSTTSAGALTQTPSVTAGHLNQQVGIARAANILEIELGTPEVVGDVDVGAAIHAATAEPDPADDDEIGVWNIIAGALRKLTWTALKAKLKTYFDALYCSAEYTVGKTAGCATIEAAIATIGATKATLLLPSGVHAVTDDATTPSTLKVVPLPGAMVTPAGGAPVTPTVSYADSAGTGTISCDANSTEVTLSNAIPTNFSVGDYLTVDGGALDGVRRRIRYIKNAKTVYVWEVFSAGTALSSNAFKYSTRTLLFSDVHGLELHDRIAVGATPDYYWVVSKPTTSSVTVSPAPVVAAYTAGTAVTRSYRFKINTMGDVDRFKWLDCTEDGGVVKFGYFVDKVKPEWWGDVPEVNGAAQGTINTNAFNHAFFSSCAWNGYYLRLPKIDVSGGQHVVNGALTPPQGIVINGMYNMSQAQAGTYIINWDPSGLFNTVELIPGSQSQGIYEQTLLEDIQIVNSNPSGIAIVAMHDLCVSGIGAGGGFWGLVGYTRVLTGGKQSRFGGINGVILRQPDSIFNDAEISYSGVDTAGVKCYGLVLAASLITAKDNIVYGSGTHLDCETASIYINAHSVYVSGGRADRADYPLLVAYGGGNIHDLQIQEAWVDTAYIGKLWDDFEGDGSKTAEPINLNMHHCRLVGSEQTSTARNLVINGEQVNGVIANNYFEGTLTGAQIADDGATLTGGQWTLIENNYGADIQTATPLALANSATPSVLLGSYFTSSNTVTYTNFTKAPTGKWVKVVVASGTPTLDFSSSNLKGNGGVDITLKAGDSWDMFFDGTNWHITLNIS